MENPGEGQCAFYCFYQAIAEKPAAKCTLTHSKSVRDLMKQYVNKDILRFYVEYGGQAVSLLGIMFQNYFSQNIQYDNVTRYYQRTISQNNNMEPLRTLWEEIQRFDKSCYSPAMFDLLPDFFKQFFIGVRLELFNVDYCMEFYLGSMVFDVDVHLWLNPSRSGMDPSCVTISRPVRRYSLIPSNVALSTLYNIIVGRVVRIANIHFHPITTNYYWLIPMQDHKGVQFIKILIFKLKDYWLKICTCMDYQSLTSCNRHLVVYTRIFL
jgi:hypothetical protein